MGSELACVYAALILQDEGMDITSENISTILKATGVTEAMTEASPPVEH